MLKKRGQAQIITTILLILLVLASIVIVWNVFNSLVKEQSEDISITPFTATIQIENVRIYFNDSVEVSLKRNPGKGEITKMRFVFYDKQGNSEFIDGSDIPEELELKDYVFAPDEISVKIDKVSVVPFYQDDVGIEAEEMKSKILRNESGDRMVYLYDDLPLSAPGDLVSWWEFESDASDSIGNNDGSLTNGAQIINKELVLDGVNDYVSIPDNEKMELGNSGTITSWFKISGWTTNYGKIITKIKEASECSSSYIFNLHVQGMGVNKTGVNICNGNTGNIIQDEKSQNFVSDKWYHVAVVVNNGNLEIFINGVSVYTKNSGDFILPDNSKDWIIGKGSAYYLNGRVDDVMVFNKPLDNRQIKSLYENQKKI